MQRSTPSRFRKASLSIVRLPRSRARMWNLVTTAGRLDIAFEPAGVKGYDDLKKDAERFEAFGVRFFVASLDDIIRSKEAAGRPKDLDDVAILRAMKRMK